MLIVNKIDYCIFYNLVKILAKGIFYMIKNSDKPASKKVNRQVRKPARQVVKLNHQVFPNPVQIIQKILLQMKLFLIVRAAEKIRQRRVLIFAYPAQNWLQRETSEQA
jgi:hypothetical protein